MNIKKHSIKLHGYLDEQQCGGDRRLHKLLASRVVAGCNNHNVICVENDASLKTPT
ncbi:uncharacterized protein PHALS_07477 [Plasmopara halstedii]|uniref:Uncharacterized protein n=1 Tax=Plasmopara halstedii TaxID=4781 RepID=A0A0P1B4L0_PLAHL|nr:uncharacterized protein PHALS_07477 [Plasmopara halstedii]CEG49727.1 hypothetical protein PHALS_07477 [Plasmopara halstedii]|eukprot:XP_024586096.1 hypothetical protein PHALS_07477 [Plasmopara halstedii]